ncbi:MAG: AMP-binding protein [Acidobacteriota bacterium]
MKFLIIGAGQTGRLVAEIVSGLPDLECIGFLDHDPARVGQTCQGLPVLGSDDRLEEFVGQVEGALPVIGDLTARLRSFERCRALGFSLVNVVAGSVVTASDLKMGEGVFISLNTAILTGVELGDHVFVGTGVNILHDTSIGRNCVIGGGTTIGASVTVGDNVAFGTGVTVASRKLRIGHNVQIASGSVILKDVPDNAFVLGNPARVIGRSPTISVAAGEAGVQDAGAPPPAAAGPRSVFGDILGREKGLSRPAVLGHAPRTYGELLAAVESVAGLLRSRGLEAGDRVGVCLDQGFEYMVALLAARRAGGIAVLAAPGWTSDEKQRVYTHAGVRWSLTDTPVLFDPGPERCDPVEGIDAVIHEYAPADAGSPLTGDAVIIYTSGTTGTPKGVVLTEAGLSANVQAVAAYLHMQPEDSAPVFTPTCYAYSLSQNLVHLWAGAAVHPIASGLMFPAEVLASLGEGSLTGLSATPTALRILSQVDVDPGLDLGSVRYVMSGGQPLHIRLVDQLDELFPHGSVVNMYGCTENSPRISYHHAGQREGMDDSGFFAVGCPVAGTTVRIESAPGVEAAPGETGEVVIAGTSLMRGYWRDEAATAERLVDGVFRTRDLGHLDDAGRLHLVGRESNIINIGNEKVSPEEVEKVLLTTPGVAKAAVYGVPDALLGESVSALVVADDGASIDATAVQRHCRGRISGYKIPRRIHFVESLPETMYGKIDRMQLDAMKE